MLKLHEIRELIKLVDESSIQEFKLDHEGSKLTIRKQVEVKPKTVSQIQQPVSVHKEENIQENVVKENNNSAPTEEKKSINNNNYHQIKSPMVGTFYVAPTPESDPYVKKGDIVTDKTVVCIIEAMKLFNEIEAEVNGEIEEILVENGQLVEYGQPLFLVKK